VPHGDPKRQHEELGYGPEGIRHAVLSRIDGEARMPIEVGSETSESKAFEPDVVK